MWYIYVNMWYINISWLIFRTVPLNRHEDEGQPSVLGGDDPDDHLFMISLILMVTMVLNIKMIMTTIYSRSAWSWWSSWSSTSRPDLSEICLTSDSSEKAPQDQIKMKSLQSSKLWRQDDLQDTPDDPDIVKYRQESGPQRIFIVNCL